MTATTRNQRGSVALEAAVVIPVMLLFVAMAVAVGRLVIAHNSVAAAAGAAARAASLERDISSATTAGQNVAATTLGDSYCTPNVSIGGNFDAPVGTPATATATVICRVDLSDVLLPGLPGQMTITARSDSIIDRYRARGR